MPDESCQIAFIYAQKHVILVHVHRQKSALKKDVQLAYLRPGSNPKDVSRNQYGLGLLPCDSNCKSKVRVTDPELQLRKSKLVEEKKPDAVNNMTKRRRRGQRLQEAKNISTLQKVCSTIQSLLLLFIVVFVIIALTYVGYDGLFRLSDWMNEVETRRRRRRYPQA